MKARSFFYACGGIFLLVAAYTLGARHAVAELVGDPNEYGPVVACFDALYYLRSDGTTWEVTATRPWTQDQIPMIPVPVSQVASWSPNQFVTKDGYFWVLTLDDGWRRGPQIPLPTIATQGKTWSGVKNGYRGK